MSYGAFLFYFWLMFIWCGVGMAFIAVASIKELVAQFKSMNSKKLENH